MHVCHEIELSALEAEESDELHQIQIEPVEDEYFVNIAHPMTKQYYISFMATVNPGRMQLVKQSNSDYRNIFCHCICRAFCNGVLRK